MPPIGARIINGGIYMRLVIEIQHQHFGFQDMYITTDHLTRYITTVYYKLSFNILL